MLVNKTVTEFIQEAASDSPTPGGGSVAALAASLGAALTTMVGNLSFGKKAYEALDPSVKEEFKANFDLLVEKTEALRLVIDEDSSAFDSVMAAFKLPKESEEEKKARSEAIQKGYMLALEVPKKCADLSLETLRLQKVFAINGNINAITDVGVGSLLAYAGLEGALLNVKINLLSIKDEKFRSDLEAYMTASLKEAKELSDEILAIVYRRLAE